MMGKYDSVFFLFFLVVGILAFKDGFVEEEVMVQEQIMKVALSEEVGVRLNAQYASTNDEFLYCLYGGVYNDTYVILELRETEVIYADNEVIHFMPCKVEEGYLGTVHSHPSFNRAPSCELSKMDAFTFGRDNCGNAGEIMGVVCGAGKFFFYGVDDLEMPLERFVLVQGPNLFGRI